MAKLKLGDKAGALAEIEQTPNPQADAFGSKTDALVQSREILLQGVLADATEDERSRYLDMFATARVSVFTLYSRTVETYLRIGKVLCELKEASKQSPLLYTRFISDYDDHGQYRPGAMPFGKEVAYRLETVYTSVINGKFDRAFQVAGRTFKEEVLPSYSTAYFFAVLSEDQLVQAVKQDLVRPDITQHQARYAVADIKREHPEPKDPPRKPKKAEDERRLARIQREKLKQVAIIKEAQTLLQRLEAEENEILLRLGARGARTILSIKSSSGDPTPEPSMPQAHPEAAE